MKFHIITFVVLLLSVNLYSQMGGATIDEILIHPKNTYGEIFIEVKTKPDSTYMVEMYNLSDSLIVVKGGLSSRNPLVLDGRFIFYTPSGKPYAIGYYKENVPVRAWSFFDESGKVINTIDYGHTHKYLSEHSGIDIGGDFVYLAETPPISEKGDIFSFVASLGKDTMYPPMAMVLGQQERVIMQITIDKQGRLINPEIIRGGTVEINMEIFRLLALSPVWKPAVYEGKPQNYVVTIPIRFSFSPDHIPLNPFILEENSGTYTLFGNDSINIYFDGWGQPSTEEEAVFIRTGKINQETNLIEGRVVDFNHSGKIVFEGEIWDGSLNGDAVIYAENGDLLEEGHYINGSRDGLWTLYHRNDQVKARVKIKDKPYLLDYYTKSGKQTVVDGNGTVKWEGGNKMYQGFKGEVRNGLRVGEWKNNVFIEVYDEDGNFQYQIDRSFNSKSYKPNFNYSMAVPSEIYSRSYIQFR